MEASVNVLNLQLNMSLDALSGGSGGGGPVRNGKAKRAARKVSPYKKMLVVSVELAILAVELGTVLHSVRQRLELLGGVLGEVCLEIVEWGLAIINNLSCSEACWLSQRREDRVCREPGLERNLADFEGPHAQCREGCPS